MGKLPQILLSTGWIFFFFENQIYLLHSTLPRSTPPTDPTEAMWICLLRGLFLIRAAVHFLRDGDGGEWRGATTGRKREGKITREEVEETREDNFELILFTFKLLYFKIMCSITTSFYGNKTYNLFNNENCLCEFTFGHSVGGSDEVVILKEGRINS